MCLEYQTMVTIFFLILGNRPIIIIRDKDDLVHAHYNVCRHRGSHICLENEGNTKALICPYHVDL